jgi:DMSO reductase anchor subunit
MHPEISLVLLTVLAGAGQGVFILMVVLDGLFASTGAVPAGYMYAAGAVALIFQAAGIIASTSHLGNPQRGWRAMLMVRNSWLSREVITLSLSVGLTLLYLVAFHFGLPVKFRLLIGLAGIVANAGFYISSSMVYASVTFVREWANAYTPLSFLVFGITSGIGVSLPILYVTGTDLSIITGTIQVFIALVTLSLIIKVLAYRFIGRAYVSVNIKNAIGINDPNIKLMDMGSSYDHYNTTEYFYPISEKNVSQSKTLTIITAFAIPLIISVVLLLNRTGGMNLLLSTVASVSMIVGLVVDRRLFFIQGNNIQNLYYANFRNAGAPNPLVSKARKGTPVPTG